MKKTFLFFLVFLLLLPIVSSVMYLDYDIATLEDTYVPYNGSSFPTDLNYKNLTNINLFESNLGYFSTLYLNSVSVNSTGLIGLECSDGQILEFETSSGLWECGTDSTGTDDQTLQEVLTQGNSANGLDIRDVNNFNMTGVFRQGVDGNMFIYDSADEIHHVNADLTRFDELRTNTFTSELIIETFYNASGDYINITGSDGRISFVANYLGEAVSESFPESTYILPLVAGTNETPILNRVYATIVAGEPVWTVSITEPTVPHAMASRILLGATGTNPYSASLQEDGDNGFLKRTQRRFRKEGLLYESGFDYNASATSLNIGEGNFINGIYDQETTLNINTSNGFYLVRFDGTYQWYDSFDDITQYSDGNTIGNNKYFNVIFGITPWDGEGNIYAVVQSKPNTEYTSVLDAYADNDNTLKVYPTEDFLQTFFLPIARMVLNEGNHANVLPSGLYAEDYRGGVAGGSNSGGGLTEADPVWTADKPDYLRNDENIDMSGYNVTADTYKMSSNTSYGMWSNETHFIMGNIGGLP